MIRALIADDETLARRALVRMLRNHKDVLVVSECGDGDTALAEVERMQPDLVFLDIRMPGQTGLSVADSLFRRFRGSVIFVTAHDEHALEAFDLNVVDYLLKPFTRERLAQALERARERSVHTMSVGKAERVVADGSERQARLRYIDRIPANHSGRIHLVPTVAIERIDAMGNYARIHARGQRYEIRETLQALERKLNPESFLRVHRSTIINIDFVDEVHTWLHGSHQIFMKDGSRVRLSRYQSAAVERLTGKRRKRA